MMTRSMFSLTATFVFISLLPGVTQAQFTQQGAKLVAIGTSFTQQGRSVALSNDGNTAIVGGPSDAGVGGAWVYTRTAGAWSQQGNKLLGTGTAFGGGATQGYAVSVSADGNTALVSGYTDSINTGAVWVFTRSAGVWSQQGTKLVGTGFVGTNPYQGYSAALSADGNTAIVGGYGDNGFAGAAWIFVRVGSIWSQQGSKLVGTGASAIAQQGYAVSLSADGNTALVGGWNDSSAVGAAWVYTRTNRVWTQQGTKLVGTGGVGNQSQGWSVALSPDGNTALLGGADDNNFAGAGWIFKRTGSVWSQEGNKLVGTGAVGIAHQGTSVALSADGNTAMLGGSDDNNFVGASWAFTRTIGVWSQAGSKLVGTGAVGASVRQGASVALSGDGSSAMVGGFADNSFRGAAWVFTRGSTNVNLPSEVGQTQFELQQNYPNPWNPSTTIRYELPKSSHVTLTVCNTLGQQVSNLVNEQQSAGYHDVVLNGDGLASGVYFYRLQAGDYVATKRLILLR